MPAPRYGERVPRPVRFTVEAKLKSGVYSHEEWDPIVAQVSEVLTTTVGLSDFKDNEVKVPHRGVDYGSVVILNVTFMSVNDSLDDEAMSNRIHRIFAQHGATATISMRRPGVYRSAL